LGGFEDMAGEEGALASELAGEATDLAVEGAPGGVDESGGIGKWAGAVFDETIQPVVLAHVFEEIFLMPSGEHGGCGGFDFAAKIGAENGGLVAFFVEPADFADPEAVAEEGAAFGKGEGDGVAVLEGDFPWDKFSFGPILAGVLVIGEDGNALDFEAGEECGGVAFAVEDEGEAVEVWVGGEGLGVGLVGDVF